MAHGHNRLELVDTKGRRFVDGEIQGSLMAFVRQTNHLGKEEKGPQWWPYNERSLRGWYSDTPLKTDDRGDAPNIRPQHLTISPVVIKGDACEVRGDNGRTRTERLKAEPVFCAPDGLSETATPVVLPGLSLESASDVCRLWNVAFTSICVELPRQEFCLSQDVLVWADKRRTEQRSSLACFPIIRTRGWPAVLATQLCSLDATVRRWQGASPSSAFRCFSLILRRLQSPRQPTKDR